jgi:hypothetical protein
MSIQGNNNNWMNEEKQRVTIQSQRGGRTGHEPLYNTTRREYYDGSLSAAQKDTRRRGSTGDSTRRLVSTKNFMITNIPCFSNKHFFLLSFTNLY